jgi:hypothetical protein
MSTAGQDFFDKNFFDTQVVVLVDYPIEDLKWYSGINDDIIDEWKKSNNVTNEEEKIARSMLDNWGASVLGIPLIGENKIKHYFEKVLWLIQSYCKKGWINPLKGINHLDNGKIVIHPGTNRCVAARFLKIKKLKTLININKNQTLLSRLSDPIYITDETTLRNTLISSEKILWRTENLEELWIAGKHQAGQKYPDFTYEFLGADAWPDYKKFNLWSNTIFKFLPLQIYIDNDVNFSFELTDQMKNMTFKDRSQNNLSVPFSYNIELVNKQKLPKDCPWIYLGKNIKNFNLFELLFFVSVDHRYSRCLDDSIIIHNPNALSNSELIIPDHYVKI